MLQNWHKFPDYAQFFVKWAWEAWAKMGSGLPSPLLNMGVVYFRPVFRIRSVPNGSLKVRSV